MEELTTTSDSPGRKVQLIELLVFVFLFLPSVLLSYFDREIDESSFSFVAFATIFHNIALLGLILFFLWRNREPLSRIGWTDSGLAREIGIGAALFIPFALVTGWVQDLFVQMGLSEPPESLPSFLAAQGPEQMVLAVLLVTVVAVAEETIYRGYLMLRLGLLMRNTVAAAVISSVIFSLGHGYEGGAGVATVGIMGLIFAAIYIWRKSLTAPIVMHFLQDFIGIVVMPLIGE